MTTTCFDVDVDDVVPLTTPLGADDEALELDRDEMPLDELLDAKCTIRSRYGDTREVTCWN